MSGQNPQPPNDHKPDYADNWRRQGKEYLEHDRKEGKVPANGIPDQHITSRDTFPIVKDNYADIDQGGDKFSFDQDVKYDAIRVSTAGTVTIRTASGETGELVLDKNETVEVEVREVLSSGTGLNLSEIYLLR